MLSDFPSFNSRQIDFPNNEKDHFIRYRTKEKPLTYIVGAKCRDGIVIASDSRLLSTEVDIGNKIWQIDENIIVGAAGHTRFYKRFLNQFNEQLKEKPPNSTKEIITMAEDVIHELHERYYKRTKEGIESFIAIRDIWKKYNIHTNNVKLFALQNDGFALPIDGIRALGSGEVYGAMFLRMLWDNSFSMRKTTELVKYIIDVIYSLGLDVHVDHRLQYYYIPYKGEPEFLDMKEVRIIEKNVRKMHVIFNKAIRKINEIRYDDSLKEIDDEYKKKHGMDFVKFDTYNQKNNLKKDSKKK